MKNSMYLFIIAILVLGGAAMWFFSEENSIAFGEMVQFGIVVILVAFAIFLGIKRLSAARRGEPPQDELSKKILQKTAAISYYISLYVWVFMIYLSDMVEMTTDELIGAGVLAMAATFAISWFVINLSGIRNV